MTDKPVDSQVLEVGLEMIAGSMRAPIREYAALIGELFGSGAQALTFFGFVVGDTFEPAVRTARNVLVLDRVDLSILRKLAEQGTKLGKAGITAPLVMTPDYIKASLDTFPLELIDILQRHTTIFGKDYFVDLSFEDRHVRLQCERELKVALISLRQGLLAAAGREKILGGIELDIGEGLMRTLRGLLWLKGGKDALPAEGVLTEVEKLVDRKLSGIRTATDLASDHAWAEFVALYEDVEALQEVADAW